MAANRIVVDRKKLGGKPVIRGTRISVDFILGLLGNGWTFETIIREYPNLEKADITAVLKYSAELIKNERVYSIK